MLGILRIIRNKFEASLYPVNYLRKMAVKVGDTCKILSLSPLRSEPNLVSIGSGVVITQKSPFLCMNSIIMPGTTLRNNCVIGVMSLVSKSVAAVSVVTGKHAKGVTDESKGKLIERDSETGYIDEFKKRVALTKLDVYSDLNNRTWKK